MFNDDLFNQMFNNLHNSGAFQDAHRRRRQTNKQKEGKISIIHTPSKKETIRLSEKFRRFKIDYLNVGFPNIDNFKSGLHGAKLIITYSGEGYGIVPDKIAIRLKHVSPSVLTYGNILYDCIVESQYVEFEMV